MLTSSYTILNYIIILDYLFVPSPPKCNRLFSAYRLAEIKVRVLGANQMSTGVVLNSLPGQRNIFGTKRNSKRYKIKLWVIELRTYYGFH